jgi:hypothetical protein
MSTVERSSARIHRVPEDFIMGARSFLSVVAVVAAAVAVTPTTAAADERPGGPNPYLSFGTEASQVEYVAWREHLAQQSAAAPATSIAGSPLVVRELEPPGVRGANDSRAKAERIRGFGTGFGRKPAASITGQLSPGADLPDVDFYRVELNAGDVFAAKITGAAQRVTIFDPAGVEVQGSSQDLSSLYPAASPLPRGGNAIADHVASVGGTHFVAVAEGTGAYQADLQVHRPGLERELRPQTIFLDFDGADVDMAIFGAEPGVRTLSPFRTFLAGWGLTEADEPAVARQIERTVRETMLEDVRRRGNNPKVRLVLRNSLEHPDTFGAENVSRVVIGGTIDESGIPTVGIAQSIDPGNFGHEDTALVLQDLLSQPAGPGVSLNTYITPASDRIAFVGEAIGNIVAHEIGHYVGGWHTDNTNALVNIMDAGGGPRVADFFGVGPDRVGGTADDTDNDLAADAYRPLEEFTGVIDNLNRTAFGLTGFRLLP